MSYACNTEAYVCMKYELYVCMYVCMYVQYVCMWITIQHGYDGGIGCGVSGDGQRPGEHNSLTYIGLFSIRDIMWQQGVCVCERERESGEDDLLGQV